MLLDPLPSAPDPHVLSTSQEAAVLPWPAVHVWRSAFKMQPRLTRTFLEGHTMVISQDGQTVAAALQMTVLQIGFCCTRGGNRPGIEVFCLPAIGAPVSRLPAVAL